MTPSSFPRSGASKEPRVIQLAHSHMKVNLHAQSASEFIKRNFEPVDEPSPADT
jgi:hypothetical protein